MSVENKTIEVLDKGYVRLVDRMGSDLSVVNAARASFAKESHELSKSELEKIICLHLDMHLSH
jgi:thymidylate synthase (FAD)